MLHFGAGTSDKGRQTVNAAPELVKADIVAMVKRVSSGDDSHPISGPASTCDAT